MMEENMLPHEKRTLFFKAVRIEFFVIIVLIAVIVGILLYLKIFPTPSSPFPKTQESFSKQPKEVVVKPQISPPYQDVSLSFVSDASSYTLSAVDQKTVEKTLQDWNAGGYLTSRNRAIKVTTLVVHLTDKEQPYNKTSNPKAGVVTSSDLKFLGKSAALYIHVSSSILNDQILNSADFFASSFYSALYSISHPANSETQLEQISKQANAEILKLLASDKSTFKITKK